MTIVEVNDDRRGRLYAALGLDPDRQGAQCVAADMIDQGRPAEEAELYLRGSSWLDARLPGGWGTTTTVRGNAVGSEVLYHAVVPTPVVAREEWVDFYWGRAADAATANDPVGDAVRRLHAEGELAVKIPETGERFTIVARALKDTVVRGYASRKVGAKRVSGAYRSIMAGALYDWISHLEVV